MKQKLYLTVTTNTIPVSLHQLYGPKICLDVQK